MPEIDFAELFSKFPFGRYREQGLHSAENFFDILEPLLLEKSEIIIDVRGVRVLTGSFLGGLSHTLILKLEDDKYREKLLSKRHLTLSKENQISLITGRIIFKDGGLREGLYQDIWRECMANAVRESNIDQLKIYPNDQT